MSKIPEEKKLKLTGNMISLPIGNDGQVPDPEVPQVPTVAEVLAAFHAAHDVKHSQKPGMVYEVWEDGEVTLQKCGDLYGQRNLHMIHPGFRKVKLPWKEMPKVGSDKWPHGWAMVADNETAMKLHEMVKALQQGDIQWNFGR